MTYYRLYLYLENEKDNKSTGTAQVSVIDTLYEL